MRTLQVAETSVSIWFSHEDVPPRRRMIPLVRQALADEGYAPWPETEAECFAAGDDALVIARPVRGRRAFFFEELEALLSGALPCPDAPSALYLLDGGYVLVLPAEAVRPALYEFGRPLPRSADWEAHAAEQGDCLLPENALGDLRRHFSP